MKLIVSAHGIYICLYRRVNSGTTSYNFFDQMALWTIIAVSFPRLDEFLEGNPNALGARREGRYKGDLSAWPSDVKSSFKFITVTRVLTDDEELSPPVILSVGFLRDLSGSTA
jgi:hypothetical protein